jgi:thiamine-phosphate pyrophosphorylase
VSARPILCLVTDRRLARGRLEDAVAAAVAGGADWVQLRERDLEDAALVVLCDRVVAAARGAAGTRPLRVLVNRRADVALACGADGVHLGYDALPLDAARSVLEAGDAATRTIGVAAHAPEEVRAAGAAGADYAHLAPIFDPLSKPAERAPLGLAALAACGGGVPVLAQGGIDASNAAAAIAAGAAGVAVTGAILSADDPEAAARALRRALDGGVR